MYYNTIPSGPKHIVCHICGAFGHLRPHYSKFHAFKRIKRKEKLELLGSCAKSGKSDLSENSMLLKKVFNALNSLSMCIFGSHSSNPSLTSHETLIPNNRSVWMRKGSYGWAFDLSVLDLILSIFVRPFMHWMSYLHAFCASCIYLYALLLFLIILYCFCFVWVKIPKPHKKWKIKKVWSYMFEHISHVSFALYLFTNGFMHLRA